MKTVAKARLLNAEYDYDSKGVLINIKVDSDVLIIKHDETIVPEGEDVKFEYQVGQWTYLYEGRITDTLIFDVKDTIISTDINETMHINVSHIKSPYDVCLKVGNSIFSFGRNDLI